ncbi:MAG: hypothetical protein AAFP19_10160 [Bacteroidota bacterium]
MSKVYINAMQIERTEKDGLPQLIKSHQEWRHFEALLQECLREQGHEVIVQVYHPDEAEESQGAPFKIYAHVTFREEEGDLFYKDMHLPELYTLDSRGWGADDSRMREAPNLSGIDAQPATAFCQQLAQRFLQNGQSKHEQPPLDDSIDLPDDYIFAPLQRPNDYVNVHHSPIEVVDFIRLLGQWANKLRQTIVVKAHPGNRADWEVMKTLEEVAYEHPYLQVVTANIHALIRRSKGVITINSGVGFESLIHGRPVVTLGRCDYQWVCHRVLDNKIEAAFDYIRQFDTQQLTRQYQFIYYYYHHHAYSLHPSELERTKRRLSQYLAQQIPAGVQL